MTMIAAVAPHTVIGDSVIPGAGKGLFAACTLRPDQVVIDYRQIPPSLWRLCTWQELTEVDIQRAWIIPVDADRAMACAALSPFSYVNHSRSPNCQWLITSKLILAAREIQEGEELTIDYRWEIRPTRNAFPSWI